MASDRDLVNFYDSASDELCQFGTDAGQRVNALFRHLANTSCGALALVGEAPGWRGARQSGVAFTDAPGLGLKGTIEESAKVVRSALLELGLDERTLLWNAVTLHPHRPGLPRTNRTPTMAELRRGLPALELAVRERQIICIGEKSAKAVGLLLGIAVPAVDVASAGARAVRVRHPSYGGATEFRRQMAVAALRF